jgi:hypothetical protein
VKLLNKRHEDRYFRLSMEGLDGGQLSYVGLGHDETALHVPPDALRSFRVFVTRPRQGGAERAVSFSFVATDALDGTAAREETTFQEPPR